MRNGRDPLFTAEVMKHIHSLRSHANDLLAMRHPTTGYGAFYYASKDEISLLKPLEDVLSTRDNWNNTRERQGAYSRSQKLRKEAERLEQEAQNLRDEANRIYPSNDL